MKALLLLLLMANHLLSAAYKAYTFADGTKLTLSDKSVLTRLADWTRIEKDPYAISVAAISMKQMAADLSTHRNTVRDAMGRHLAHGVVRVAIEETPTRSRRYELDLSKVRTRSGVTCDVIAAELRERGRQPLPPYGQAALPLGGQPLHPRGAATAPLEGQPLHPRGAATAPVPDLPASPAFPERSTGAVRAGVDWFEECKLIHGGECGQDRYKHGLRKQTERVAGQQRTGTDR